MADDSDMIGRVAIDARKRVRRAYNADVLIRRAVDARVGIKTGQP